MAEQLVPWRFLEEAEARERAAEEFWTALCSLPDPPPGSTVTFPIYRTKEDALLGESDPQARR